MRAALGRHHLQAGTIDVLAEHQTHQRADRGKAGEAWVEIGLVFTEPDGSPLHPPASPTTSST
jgi:hypothetical protein